MNQNEIAVVEAEATSTAVAQKPLRVAIARNWGGDEATYPYIAYRIVGNNQVAGNDFRLKQAVLLNAEYAHGGNYGFGCTACIVGDAVFLDAKSEPKRLTIEGPEAIPVENSEEVKYHTGKGCFVREADGYRVNQMGKVLLNYAGKMYATDLVVIDPSEEERLAREAEAKAEEERIKSDRP